MPRAALRPAMRPGAVALLAAFLLSACWFESVPTGALQGARPIASAAPLAAAPMPSGRDMDASLRAWAEFCIADKPGCRAAAATVALTSDVWALLAAVQQQVNDAHPYRPEPLGMDAWRTLNPGEPGDCEDLALTKRERLTRAGLPAGALRPATCRLRGTPFAPGDGHAVLTVETDLGTYVMGVEGDVVPWHESECDSWGYRWAGATWVSLGG